MPNIHKSRSLSKPPNCTSQLRKHMQCAKIAGEPKLALSVGGSPPQAKQLLNRDNENIHANTDTCACILFCQSSDQPQTHLRYAMRTVRKSTRRRLCQGRQCEQLLPRHFDSRVPSQLCAACRLTRAKVISCVRSCPYLGRGSIFANRHGRFVEAQGVASHSFLGTCSHPAKSPSTPRAYHVPCAPAA